MAHTMAEEKQVFNCGECSFATNYKNSVNKHVKRIHQKNKDHKCELCEYKAFSEKEIAKHIKSRHFDTIGLTNQYCPLSIHTLVCNCCD